MQCNYNSFIQIINFHGLFRNALRCRKTGACRILVPLRYLFCPLRQSNDYHHCQNFRGGIFQIWTLSFEQMICDMCTGMLIATKHCIEFGDFYTCIMHYGGGGGIKC